MQSLFSTVNAADPLLTVTQLDTYIIYIQLYIYVYRLQFCDSYFTSIQHENVEHTSGSQNNKTFKNELFQNYTEKIT